MIGSGKGPAGPLDPGREDPGYWPRFRRRTTALAQPELERRRFRSSDTVSAVVTSWARTIVPAAVAVAAVAALLILADPVAELGGSGTTERGGMVGSPLNGDPMAAVLGPDSGTVTITLADEAF